MNGMIWNFNSQFFVDSVWERAVELAKRKPIRALYENDSRAITKDYLIKSMDEAFVA